MLRFLYYNNDEFDSIAMPFVISLMKAVGAMMTEIINLGLLCG
jgi:hypothetical protein